MDAFEVVGDWLYPWQEQWIADQSKWKVALKARQIGFTTGCAALDALLHAYKHDNHTCYMVSTKVGNAREQMLDPIKHKFIPAFSKDSEVGEFFKACEINKNVIHLPNGSKIKAEANDSNTLRGNNSSSYWGDEIAFWPERVLNEFQDAIWPQIENPNNPHARVSLFATPWTHNFFYDVVKNKDDMYDQFSRHKWDIYDAVEAASDFNLDPAKLKDRYPSQKFNREYGCSFLALGDTYFSRTELKELTQHLDVDDNWTCYLGVDLAKVNDLSSVVPLYVNESNGRMHVPKVWMMRSVNYKEQARIVDDIIEQLEPEECCVDITVHQSFSSLLESNVDGKRGDRERKKERTESIKEYVEDETISFDWTTLMKDSEIGFTEEPTDALLDDLCKVQQSETPSGNVRYEAPRDDSGHADSYSALLLALDAKEGGPQWCFG